MIIVLKWWIPAEELEEMNDNIKMVSTYPG